MAFTIPGGPKKDTPLPEAEVGDIQYWVKRISKGLEDNPNQQYADKNRAWLRGAQAELDRRKAGGGRAPTKQASRPRPQQTQALATGSAQQFSLDRVVHDPAAATVRLHEIAGKCHLVSPATAVDALPPGFGIAVSMVAINPDASKDGPGEVVKIAGKLMLSATSLSRIGAAAGVDWDSVRSGRLDDRSHPHYCHFKAVGYVRNFDGSTRTLTGEVEIDARDGGVDEQEIREKARRRAVKYPNDPNDGGDSQLMELRKFILRNAERKAKNRAIIDMGLRRSYQERELGIPFAVARLMWTGQSDDPELKREFARIGAEKMLTSTAQLYGVPAAPAAAPGQLPQFVGHTPPPVGAAAPAGEYDYGDEYDVDGYGEEVQGQAPPAPQAQAPAAQPAAAQPAQGLPPDQDRGPNPEKY